MVNSYYSFYDVDGFRICSIMAIRHFEILDDSMTVEKTFTKSEREKVHKWYNELSKEFNTPVMILHNIQYNKYKKLGVIDDLKKSGIKVLKSKKLPEGNK